MTPEVRLSPDGRVAVLYWSRPNWLVMDNSGSVREADVRAGGDYVSDWTPLLPASSEDGAA